MPKEAFYPEQHSTPHPFEQWGRASERAKCCYCRCPCKHTHVGSPIQSGQPDQSCIRNIKYKIKVYSWRVLAKHRVHSLTDAGAHMQYFFTSNAIIRTY